MKQRKKRKKIVIRVVDESKCLYIVNYTYYNRKYHTRSRRRARCSRWTFLECGLCHLHHEKAEEHSNFGCRVMYKDVEAL